MKLSCSVALRAHEQQQKRVDIFLTWVYNSSPEASRFGAQVFHGGREAWPVISFFPNDIANFLSSGRFDNNNDILY